MSRPPKEASTATSPYFRPLRVYVVVCVRVGLCPQTKQGTHKRAGREQGKIEFEEASKERTNARPPLSLPPTPHPRHRQSNWSSVASPTLLLWSGGGVGRRETYEAERQECYCGVGPTSSKGRTTKRPFALGATRLCRVVLLLMPFKGDRAYLGVLLRGWKGRVCALWSSFLWCSSSR